MNVPAPVRRRLFKLIGRWYASRWRSRLAKLLRLRQYHPSLRAQETPDQPCVIMADSGVRLTFAELDAASMKTARLFRDSGLAVGDAIAVFLENHPRYFEICWAAQRAGLYYTTINSHLTAGEAAYIVNDCGAGIVISSRAMRAVAADLPSLAPNVRRWLMVDGVIEGFEAYEPLADAEPATPLPDETEGKSMLYSSGTTGRPKGISSPLTGAPITSLPPIVHAIAKHFEITKDCVFLNASPLYHAAPLGISLTVQAWGGTCVVMDAFDAESLLKHIETYRITHVNLVPTMFVRLLKLPEAVRRRYDTSSLCMAIHGAAPCPVPVKEQMIDWWGPVLKEYYSATEGNVLCIIDSPTWLEHKGSVGKPVLGPVHVLDEDGREVPRGTPGELWSESPLEFTYHNDAEKTAASRNARGWTTLGDVGYLDDDGFLYLTDRKAFTIISNGVNVYPQEAENVLVMHPQVLDAAVIGVPDEMKGQAVKAVVQPADIAAATPDLEAELIAYCRRHLAAIKCPASVDFVDELPRQDNGKLYKDVLIDRYRTGGTASVH